MAEYDNRNRFTLFRNARKRPDKRDPDFNGTFTDASGKEYWIDAWSTTPKNGGDKFLSGSVRAKDEKPVPRQAASTPKSAMDDEVPF